MRRRTSNLAWGAALLALLIGAVLTGGAAAQAGDATRVFNAPMDRVWTVTRSTLRGLGWDIDKEDREGGWIRTDSRRLEGEDYGVYAQGTRQRLRLVLKGLDPGRTQVTVERRVWKQERILWMDKEEDIPSQDTKAERQVLEAIGAAL
jgi:hypothetical protein